MGISAHKTVNCILIWKNVGEDQYWSALIIKLYEPLNWWRYKINFSSVITHCPMLFNFFVNYWFSFNIFKALFWKNQLNFWKIFFLCNNVLCKFIFFCCSYNGVKVFLYKSFLMIELWVINLTNCPMPRNTLENWDHRCTNFASTEFLMVQTQRRVLMCEAH
jgi:hypothetical protein